MNKVIVLTLGVLCTPAIGATFIGNGGSAGDLDLAITRTEIKQALEAIDEKTEGLCTCPDEVSDNELCGVLRSLDKKQLNYCREILLKTKEVVVALTARNSRVKFFWSDEDLSVYAAHAARRAVDAVTQAPEAKIIINRRRFQEMPPSYRIALVTHELYHLVPIDGKLTGDGERAGSFNDGKDLLDALGAAVAVQAQQEGVISDFADLNVVSRRYKSRIFQFDTKIITRSNKASAQLLLPRSGEAASFLFEYKPKDIGFRLGVESGKITSIFANSLTVKEASNLYYAGLSYHWSPIDAYLSRWSETQLSLFLDGLVGNTRYTVADEVVTFEDHSLLRGLGGGAQLSVPIVLGFWGNVGYQLRRLQYNYQDLGIQIKDLQQLISIGVGYAF